MLDHPPDGLRVTLTYTAVAKLLQRGSIVAAQRTQSLPLLLHQH
jgi:hypothetical protein